MKEERYTPVESSGKTTIHPELTLWDEVEFSLSGYHGYNVSGLIRLHEKRLELDELVVKRMPGGKEVTGYGLRELQPPAIIRRSLRVLETYPPDGNLPDPDISGDKLFVTAFGLTTRAEVESAKRAGPSSQELLKLVSRIYVGAQAVQDRPAKAIQETFDVSPRTAGNWIAKSKAAGYIDIGEDHG